MVYLYVSGALGSIDASLEEASENLGVAGIRRVMKVTFPVIMPTILSISTDALNAVQIAQLLLPKD